MAFTPFKCPVCKTTLKRNVNKDTFTKLGIVLLIMTALVSIILYWLHDYDVIGLITIWSGGLLSIPYLTKFKKSPE
jgi:hypothetical protein